MLDRLKKLMACNEADRDDDTAAHAIARERFEADKHEDAQRRIGMSFRSTRTTPLPIRNESECSWTPVTSIKPPGQRGRTRSDAAGMRGRLKNCENSCCCCSRTAEYV